MLNTFCFYFRAKCKQLETYNKELFIAFLQSGKTLVDAASEGDLDAFKKTFANAVDKEIMYWHVTKAMKAAIKHRQLEVIDFIVEEMDTPLDHDAFDGLLHVFVFGMKEDYRLKNELNIDTNKLPP